ncbi:hypothetical protein Q2380_04385 [Enterobacter hormaechei]|nr:hypothetical protein [Enterobacter hormaechei]MDO2398882.1 hypothetical protein [Enterobacter hormaechei]MDO2404116.1 hypothetical protein [Enterobacter hormaechei]MDO2418618.1 hypothetical protein [Enterobacter hormaechei]MDO2426257.1 hypothetical protein [Enterobacter hormaechei]CZY22854.1 Uncharacterised protein [Enterobacter hormaechei]
MLCIVRHKRINHYVFSSPGREAHGKRAFAVSVADARADCERLALDDLRDVRYCSDARDTGARAFAVVVYLFIQICELAR